MNRDLVALGHYVAQQSPRAVAGKLRQMVRYRLYPAMPGLAFRPHTLDSTAPRDSAHLTSLTSFAEEFAPFGDRFVDTSQVAYGTFSLRGHTHDFGSIADVAWGTSYANSSPQSQFEHDLAFFNWAIQFVQTHPGCGPSVVAALVEQLDRGYGIEKYKSIPFHWSPIALALRTMSLITVIALPRTHNCSQCGEAENRIERHALRCGALLRRTSEDYLGYNHALFGRAALAALGVLEGGKASRDIDMCVRLLDRHVLPDGFWVERSPAYHVHMLLITRAVLAIARSTDHHAAADLEAFVKRMQAALDVVVHPDGEIALYNDSALDDAPGPSSVQPNEWQPAGPGYLEVKDAGYARLAAGPTTVIFDAGPLGPNDVVGHAHADYLAVEISMFGTRLITDPGVGSITAGALRQWTREASSHNGPTLAGLAPAEFFGAWRVGRRGTAWLHDRGEDSAGSLSISGTCDGYARYGHSVTRTVRLRVDGSVELTDSVTGAVTVDFESRFIITNEWTITRASATSARAVHRATGHAVAITTVGGQLLVPTEEHYYLRGPMSAASGTAITVRGDATEFRVILSPEVGHPNGL